MALSQIRVSSTGENGIPLCPYLENSRCPNRPKNCDITEVRDVMREKFLKRIVPDPADIWGQNISDRNFYTTPSTRIVNDQTRFAKWCYGTMGECKTYGKGCLKNALT